MEEEEEEEDCRKMRRWKRWRGGARRGVGSEEEDTGHHVN